MRKAFERFVEICLHEDRDKREEKYSEEKTIDVENSNVHKFYVKRLPGNARTKVHWIITCPSDSSRMMGLCWGLSEWGIR